MSSALQTTTIDMDLSTEDEEDLVGEISDYLVRNSRKQLFGASSADNNNNNEEVIPLLSTPLPSTENTVYRDAPVDKDDKSPSVDQGPRAKKAMRMTAPASMASTWGTVTTAHLQPELAPTVNQKFKLRMASSPQSEGRQRKHHHKQ